MCFDALVRWCFGAKEWHAWVLNPPDVIRKEAWLFCRTSSSVRQCGQLEEPNGHKRCIHLRPKALRGVAMTTYIPLGTGAELQTWSRNANPSLSPASARIFSSTEGQFHRTAPELNQPASANA
jgi:hypothetical protein